MAAEMLIHDIVTILSIFLYIMYPTLLFDISIDISKKYAALHMLPSVRKFKNMISNIDIKNGGVSNIHISIYDIVTML